jgi:hypothetical protein
VVGAVSVSEAMAHRKSDAAQTASGKRYKDDPSPPSVKRGGGPAEPCYCGHAALSSPFRPYAFTQ